MLLPAPGQDGIEEKKDEVSQKDTEGVGEGVHNGVENTTKELSQEVLKIIDRLPHDIGLEVEYMVNHGVNVEDALTRIRQYFQRRI